MFNKVKNALYNVVGGLEALPSASDNSSTGPDRVPAKFRYTRPLFLQLNTDDEIQVSADHIIRPIIVPRDITKLPWNTGYAEVINAGKSIRNEDQASVYRGMLHRSIQVVKSLDQSRPVSQASLSSQATDSLENANGDTAPPGEDQLNGTKSDGAYITPPSTPEPTKSTVRQDVTLPWIYFGMFDGHAGSGAAVVAANTLFRIIEEKLVSITEHLLPYSPVPEANKVPNSQAGVHPGYSVPEKEFTKDSLIVGALESAFWDMDKQIGQDKHQYKVTGGCTAVISVLIMGKLYVANAGDSRAIACHNNKVVPLSNDFTPESERDRIRYLGLLRPELLGNEFTHLEYIRRPVRKDLGKKMLFRDAYMSGWAYKTISVEDLRFPLIYGEGKRSRVLATIGVTRGFGDHDLKAQNTDVDIKPFLTAQPEVQIFDLMANDLTDSDVLVLGTDGLWDITSNEKAAEIVQKSLDHFPANDLQRYKYRYISAAQDLVMHSRGKLRERNWRTSDNKSATIDDISVFVIPLKPYKEEFIQWLTPLGFAPETKDQAKAGSSEP